MRVLVLLVAVVLSLGSGADAQQRHALAKYSCSTQPAAQQANCYANANTEYAVESQREIVDEQNQYVAQQAAQQNASAAHQQTFARCERVAGIYMRCQLITPAEFIDVRDYCIGTIANANPTGYPRTICVEQSGDCDQVRWCLRPAPARAAH